MNKEIELGVGDGSGKLFVRGDYESIKTCQRKLLERMKLIYENARLRKALEFYSNPSDYVAPFTGGMGKLYFDCGDKAREALKDVR